MNYNYAKLADSIESLSSGLKITEAADDPAMYAHTALLRSEISATQQGIRNANDAISLLQVADGAMEVIDEKIVRMKELAEQAATGTYDSTQRAIIDSEYQHMASEVSRIANSTQFNGIKLLDGTLSGSDFVSSNYGDYPEALKIHYGDTNRENQDFTIFSIAATTSEAFGLGNNADPAMGGHSISTQEAAASALEAINNAISSKAMIRADIGALQNRMELTVGKLELEVENAQVAESAISDIDVANEMTQFVKYQMLMQTAGSMLAQANSVPEMSLQLLR